MYVVDEAKTSTYSLQKLAYFDKRSSETVITQPFGWTTSATQVLHNSYNQGDWESCKIESWYPCNQKVKPPPVFEGRQGLLKISCGETTCAARLQHIALYHCFRACPGCNELFHSREVT